MMMNRKPVQVISYYNKKVIGEFRSINEACLKLDENPNTIHKHIKGQVKKPLYIIKEIEDKFYKVYQLYDLERNLIKEGSAEEIAKFVNEPVKKIEKNARELFKIQKKYMVELKSDKEIA